MEKYERRINVYEGEQGQERVIARVRYNQLLDSWDGNNWCNGGHGLHKGITRLRDGRWVILIGSQWQGARDYGYVVSPGDALQEVLKSGNLELLEQSKYASLKTLLAENMVEEDE